MLSPQITLFYNHSLSHSSKLSGILTINAILIIILFILFFDKDILNHDKEVPKVSWYNLCAEDSGEFHSGEFPINSSSLFHFISIVNVPHHMKNSILLF